MHDALLLIFQWPIIRVCHTNTLSDFITDRKQQQQPENEEGISLMKKGADGKGKPLTL